MPLPSTHIPANQEGPVSGARLAPGTAPERMGTVELTSQAAAKQPQFGGLPDPAMAAIPTQQVSVHTSVPVANPAQVTQPTDESLIEKECIAKAKVIVRQTAGDPFVQTKEISKVKAELLKRRFGKELKANEE